MKKETQTEKLERRKKEYIEYKQKHGTITKMSKFSDGTSMAYFENQMRKLKEEPEIIEQIEKNKALIQKYINVIHSKSNELLEQINIPKEFKNLNQTEKIIIYRTCFFSKSKKSKTYTIENIKIAEEVFQKFKEIYEKCYATYPEKVYQKGLDISKEEIKQSEIEKLEYLNIFCANTKWQKDKIKNIAPSFNESPLELKNLAIKYRYLTLNPKTKKFIPTSRYPNLKLPNFITEQIFAYTIEDITPITKPTTLKAYRDFLDYQNSANNFWESLENIEGLPPSEKAKLIINIETKTNIYKKWHTLNKKQKQEQEQQETEIKFFEEGIHYLELFISDKNNTPNDFSTKNNLGRYQLEKIINLSEKHDKKLYKKYLLFLKEQQIFAEQSIKFIIEGFKKEKDFTILDYYSQANMNLRKLKLFIKNSKLTSEEEKIVRKFINQGLVARPLTKAEKQYYIDTEHTLQNKDGILYQTTKDERENIINYLEKYNQLSAQSYIIALKRYINGQLELEQKNKIK